MLKLKVAVFLLFCCYPFVGFADIWSTTLNKYDTFDGGAGVHYAANTIQAPGTTNGLFLVGYSSLVPAMPFLSTYDDWSLSLISLSNDNKNFPLIAVKFDGPEVNKLPDDLMMMLGIVDRADVDFFLNVQGLPNVTSDSRQQNVLFQPHTWGHSKVPLSGSVASASTIYLLKKNGLLRFDIISLSGSRDFISHDSRLSGLERIVDELTYRSSAIPNFDRTDTDHIYINSENSKHND